MTDHFWVRDVGGWWDYVTPCPQFGPNWVKLDQYYFLQRDPDVRYECWRLWRWSWSAVEHTWIRRWTVRGWWMIFAPDWSEPA